MTLREQQQGGVSPLEYRPTVCARVPGPCVLLTPDLYVFPIETVLCFLCYALSLSHVRLFATPWTAVQQASVLGDSPGRNIGVGCHALLQGIFLTQGSNAGLLHCRWILYRPSHQGILILSRENPKESIELESIYKSN